jgi:hypothetical protein
MLIGLCGAAGAGKNTVAEMLVGFRQIAFADPLYECVAAITGLPAERLRDRDAKEAVIDWLGKSPRQLLQIMGTEFGREMVHPELWIKIAMARIADDLAAGRNVVITDVRFDNEAQAVVAAGGECWRVVRKGWRCLDAGTAMHPSEAGVSGHLIARTIDNSGTLNDLRGILDAATI